MENSLQRISQEVAYAQYQHPHLESAAVDDDQKAHEQGSLYTLSNGPITASAATDKVWDYGEGGFHPIHLGDHYDSGRYKIVHKLGSGGWATVWLARDKREDRWVALKFFAADESTEDVCIRSQNICNAASSYGDNAAFLVNYRHFWHCGGPNGNHLCQVSTVQGPSAECLSDGINSRLTPSLSRWASYEITRALANLHAKGICHGDVTTGNILFSSRIDDYTEKDLEWLFGPPKCAALESEFGKSPGPEAPRYFVKPLDFLSAQENIIETGVKLVDFDLSFPATSPPKGMLGTQPRFLAPEVAAGFPASTASDVWALGCCIFRIRSGGHLLPDHKLNSSADLLRSVIQILPREKFPPSWCNVLFDNDGEPTDDPNQGKPLWTYESERPLQGLIEYIWDQPENDIVNTSRARQERRRPLQNFSDECTPFSQSYSNIVWKPKATKIDDVHLSNYHDELLEEWPKVSDEETYWLHDLLSRILTYEPSERLTAREILDHPWFRMN